ncbi:MAG: outer membrane beta-barrel protein [Gemmatimonadota bacterium]|nr:outer membrane beta-barrel protein [Gemmatimonadota bacterium]
MKRSLFLAIATIALVAAPRASQAQFGLVKPIQLGIAGGAAQPMSDLKDGANMGYNGTVAMGINLPFIPVGLRVDGAYNQFGEKAGVGAKLHVISATGNVVWRLPSVGISPYLIGGAGLYMSTATTTGTTSVSDTQNHLGWNAGAGINLPLSVFKAFVEARYNRVSTDTGSLEFVPLTFGIMF